MDIAKHWHAYAWSGHERPADAARMDHSQGLPSIEIVHYLLKPARHVARTFDNPDGIADALQWMREGYELHPWLGDHFLSLDARLGYAEDSLSRGADVIWGDYTQRQRYATRALIACPRPSANIACPYAH